MIVIVAVAPAFPVTTYEHVPAATGENVNVPLPDSGDAVAMPAHVVVLSVNAPV